MNAQLQNVAKTKDPGPLPVQPLLRRRFLALCGAAGVAFTAIFKFFNPRPKPTFKLTIKDSRLFAYDLSEFQQVDPNLIQYREVGRIESQFQEPRRMGIHSGEMLAIAGDSAIKLFSINGELIREIKLTNAATCVAFDQDKLFVGVTDHLEIYDLAGKQIAKWAGFGPLAHCTYIAAAEDIFVADSANRDVLRFDRAGKLLAHIGRRDAVRNIPGLVVPSPYLAVACTAGGSLYVSNPGRHRIEMYAPDGDLLGSLGDHSMSIGGFCGCCNPVAFALLPDGGLVTSEKGLARVKILNQSGELQSVVAPPSIFNAGAFAVDVAVGPNGRIYALDTGTRAVRTFEKIYGDRP